MFPMSKIFKSIVGLVIIGAAIGLAAAPAKAESKTAQCQRFKQATTVFGNQYSKIKRDPNQSYSANMDRFLSNSENALKRFQVQQFSDPKIRGFQQGTLDIMVRFHNDLIDIAEAAERRDSQGYASAYTKMLSGLQLSGNQVEKQYKAYCGRSL
jgi:hypothetical protein